MISRVPPVEPGKMLVSDVSADDGLRPYPGSPWGSVFDPITRGGMPVCGFHATQGTWSYAGGCSADWPWEELVPGQDVPGMLRIIDAPPVALTLWPEWAWAICELGKPTENRGWIRQRTLPVGATLAIHAGSAINGRPSRVAAEAGADAVTDTWRRANPGQPDPWPFPEWERRVFAAPRSAIVAVATIDGYDIEQRTGWDVPGMWHWRLRDVRVLRRPVVCAGGPGLWRVPPAKWIEIEQELQEVPDVG